MQDSSRMQAGYKQDSKGKAIGLDPALLSDYLFSEVDNAVYFLFPG
jgi:hypothetical protein